MHKNPSINSFKLKLPIYHCFLYKVKKGEKCVIEIRHSKTDFFVRIIKAQTDCYILIESNHFIEEKTYQVLINFNLP